jgi:hypothetical protein
MKKHQKGVWVLLFMGLALLAAGGCAHVQDQAVAAPAQPAASLPVPVTGDFDDIPMDASPAVRAHLIKLKEMLQAGQITQPDYDSRRTLLLSR